MITPVPARPVPRTRRAVRATARLLAVGLLAAAVPALVAGPARAIDGGSSTTVFPFVAELRNTTTGGLCTGSLIDPSWVLTAAHCSVPRSVGDVTARIGNTSLGTGGQLRRVTRIVPHPDYRGGHNDLALWELSSPVTTVAPVRLANGAQAPLYDGPRDSGIAVGWGGNSAGTLPSRLQTVGVTIGSTVPDAAGIPTLPIGPGTCAGDSGSPLIVQSNGYWQGGVLKAAATDCSSGSYSDVRPGANRDWLQSRLTGLPFTAYGIADWDADGSQDIVTMNRATGELLLYPGRGVRGYSGVAPVRIGADFRGTTPFGVGDWDRDGHQDLVVRNDATGDLILYPGQSRRGISAAAAVRIGNGWGSFTPAGITDWDRDGHQDILARNNDNGQLMLYPGQSVRGYSQIQPVRLDYSWNLFTPFGAVDWDRDGNKDVLVRHNDTGDLLLFPGRSVRGQITDGAVRIGNGWTGASPFGLADWDRDGHQDIVTRIDAGGDLKLYPGQSVRGYSQIQPIKIGNGW